jgi:hypothetical protein
MRADSQSKRPLHIIEPPPRHLERPYDPEMRIYGDFLRIDVDINVEILVIAEQVVRVFQSGCLGGEGVVGFLKGREGDQRVGI